MTRYSVAFVAVLLSTVCLTHAQQNCPLPPSLQPASSTENIFSDPQEVDLGDAMAETIALHVNIIENEELTAHLRQIGQRLVEHLPPTQMKFRFYLIDLPEVNAFSIAGGRVYVSRKIVAFARNDDEVAGILAHELGHIVTHQSAIEMTRVFREVLGVTQVGNREDIFRKYHQYLEAFTHGKRGSRRQEEEYQIVADQVSIYALARAGFTVQAFPDFWGRFNQLHGRGGSWFTDLFGVTTPEQHRLRDMIKNSAALPSACVDQSPSKDTSAFQAWQQAVVEYEDSQHSENLPGLIFKRRFSQRLRPDISNLRFSPDGKFVLAQDDGGINILSRAPLSFLFYIPASDARAAHFTPDSSSIVFTTAGLRAEKWSIAERKRSSVHELTLRDPCLQSELSPDGTVLACLSSDFALRLVDVASSSVFLEKKAFYKPALFEVLSLLLRLVVEQEDEAGTSEDAVHFVSMGFSPDGNYFLAAHGVPRFVPNISYQVQTSNEAYHGIALDERQDFVTSSTVMYDLVSHRELSIRSSIKEILPVSFTFVGPGRVAGLNSLNPKKSHVLEFPSGRTISELSLWHGIEMRAAAHGDSLLIGPLANYPLGIIELANQTGWIGIKQRTADVYDGLFVTERVNGELALHTKDGALVAALQLPESNLGRLVSGAVSPDLNYLAISSRTRGVIWNVTRDIRAFQTRRFNGLGFDGKLAYADLPKFDQTPRQIAQLRIDSGGSGGHELKDEIAVQQGLYLIVTKPRSGNALTRSNADVQVEDIRTGQVLWSRYFPKDLPAISFDPTNATAVLRWQVSQSGAQEELRNLPELKRHAGADYYLCEVVDANLGGISATFLIKSSVQLLHSSATHDWAVMEAGGDQLLTFALPAGEEKGHFFGEHPTLSSSGSMAADSATREVTVYDLRTSEARQRYRFAAPVAVKAFSEDGKRLLVFTSDQTVYVLDTTVSSATEPALASSSGN